MKLNIKQWIIGKENIIVKKEEYDTLLEQLDIKNKEIVRLTKEYEDSQTKFKSLQTDHNLLNYRFKQIKTNLDEIQHKYKEVKDYNAQVKFEFKTDKPEKPKNKKTKHKRKHCKILKGESPTTTGVIKKLNQGGYYQFYVKDKETTGTKTGTLQECELIFEEYNKQGLKPKDVTKLRKLLFPTGITLHKGKYMIRKQVNGVYFYFGNYEKYTIAKEIYDFLDFMDWDLQFLPKRVLNIQDNEHINMEEYIMKMRMFMGMNKEFQQYLGNPVDFTFYDK